MDAAEAWLQEHDPSYLRSRQGWKNLNADGEYASPGQEVPWGDATDLEAVIDAGRGRYVETVPFVVCARCDAEFRPQITWHRFCSEKCRAADEQRRRRARRSAV